MNMRALINLVETTETMFLYHGTTAEALASILTEGVEAPSYWGDRMTAEQYADGALLRVPISAFDQEFLMVNDLMINSMIDDGDDAQMPSDWRASLEEFGSVRYDVVLHVSPEFVVR